MHVFLFNSFPMMLRETAASMGRCSLKVETSSQHVPNLHCQHWGMDAFANIADQGFQSLARTWHVSRWNWCQWNIGEWGWWGTTIRATDVFFSVCHHLEALPAQKPWINWRFHGTAETCNPYLLGTNRSNTASAWRKDLVTICCKKLVKSWLCQPCLTPFGPNPISGLIQPRCCQNNIGCFKEIKWLFLALKLPWSVSKVQNSLFGFLSTSISRRRTRALLGLGHCVRILLPVPRLVLFFLLCLFLLGFFGAAFVIFLLVLLEIPHPSARQTT